MAVRALPCCQRCHPRALSWHRCRARGTASVRPQNARGCGGSWACRSPGARRWAGRWGQGCGVARQDLCRAGRAVWDARTEAASLAPIGAVDGWRQGLPTLFSGFSQLRPSPLAHSRLRVSACRLSATATTTPLGRLGALSHSVCQDPSSGARPGSQPVKVQAVLVTPRCVLNPATCQLLGAGPLPRALGVGAGCPLHPSALRSRGSHLSPSPPFLVTDCSRLLCPPHPGVLQRRPREAGGRAHADRLLRYPRLSRPHPAGPQTGSRDGPC